MQDRIGRKSLKLPKLLALIAVTLKVASLIYNAYWVQRERAIRLILKAGHKLWVEVL